MQSQYWMRSDNPKRQGAIPMNRGVERSPSDAKTGVPPASPRSRKAAELDLDRLVWDTEYREAMRPYLTSQSR